MVNLSLVVYINKQQLQHTGMVPLISYLLL